MGKLVSQIVEGLRDAVFTVVSDLGKDKLSAKDSVAQIAAALREHAYPLRSIEAKELFHEGSKIYGPLARQRGEPMNMYVSRRRRWWTRLTNLDKEMNTSESILADMLLECARLDETQKLLVLTSCGNQMKMSMIAEALIKQHPKIHLREKSHFGEPSRVGYGKGHGKQPRPTWGTKPPRSVRPSFKPYRRGVAYLAEDEDDLGASTAAGSQDSDGEGDVCY